jgi:hypothetical protein
MGGKNAADANSEIVPRPLIQADLDSVYWALNAFGCHSKEEQTRPLNPKENPAKNLAKP